jgi:hypothetical protein
MIVFLRRLVTDCPVWVSPATIFLCLDFLRVLDAVCQGLRKDLKGSTLAYGALPEFDGKRFSYGAAAAVLTGHDVMASR